MLSKIYTTEFNLNAHWKTFKFFLLPTNCVTLVIYTFLRLGSYLAPFSFGYELLTFLKTIGVSSLIALSLYGLFLGVDAIDRKWVNRPKIKSSSSLLGVLALIIALGITSCHSRISRGIKKDFSSGLKTQYENLEPQESVVVMNGETIGHNEIPLGEQFTIINKDVSGLTRKDGKVSVGLSLSITDTNGKVLLNEPDLFEKNGTVEEAQSKYLKCIVTTGEPMAWDKDYLVKASFWDKWGSGKIVNELRIHMIDIP